MNIILIRTLQTLCGFVTVAASWLAIISLGGKAPWDPNYLVFTSLLVTGVLAVTVAALIAPQDRQLQTLASFGGAGILTLALAGLLFPVFQSAKAAATMTTCMSNLKGLGLALLLYSSDHDERFPPASVWLDRAAPRSSKPAVCPAAKSTYSYALNAALDAAKDDEIEEVANTAMIFDADAYGPNASGGKEWLSPRHGRANIAFTDGRVTGFSSYLQSKIRWNP